MKFIDAADQFVLDKGVIFCNHGSFGATPRCVLDFKQKFDMQMNGNPDLWFRKTCVDLWFENRAAIAPVFGTLPTNLAFVLSATQGANAAISSIIWQPGDVILVTDVTHPAVREACNDVTVRHPGVEIKFSPLPYPIENDQQLVDLYVNAAEQVLEAGKTPRLAIVDAVSSMPGIRLPFEKITKVLQNKGVLVHVDGAHALGQIEDLNFDAIGADFFAGSLHKWFYSPKGTAIFYCAPQHQATIRPPVVSFDYCKLLPKRFEDPLSGHFFWQGTLDNTGYACITKVLEFIDSLGGIKAIQQNNNNLAREAEKILLAEMNDAERFHLPESCQPPAMVNLYGPDLQAKKVRPSCLDITEQLFMDENAWFPISKWHGRWYYRYTSQIYNKIDDYHKLAVAVNTFAAAITE